MLHHHPTPDGTRYPVNHVVALFDTPEQVREAGAALLTEGFAPDDIVSFHGQDGLAAIQKKETRFSRLSVALARWTEEGFGGHKLYMDGLNEGRSLLMVYTPSPRDVDRAHDALKQHHGHHIASVRRWTTEGLHDH
jgi:hypothetical protein